MAALYALALQAILGGMLMAGPLGPAHALCLQSAGSADADPEKVPVAHDHLACCTAAPHIPALQAPATTALPIVWPQRRIAVLAWRPEVVAVPRAPPRFRHSARAPPVV
ncbi:hypothetical protein [Methylobacterium radiodurans]|uniref:hypothetical protein n=1 Tax=Methylobacterium radiodurans TaxID=2202828 RepID=UPI001FEA27B4|nr:hypothetical protein [Methylobacterium radiodurans]